MHCRQLGMYMSNSLCCAIFYLLAEYIYTLEYTYFNKYVENIYISENDHSRIYVHILDNECIPTLRPKDTKTSPINIGRICPIPTDKFDWQIFFSRWQYIQYQYRYIYDTVAKFASARFAGVQFARPTFSRGQIYQKWANWAQKCVGPNLPPNRRGAPFD